MPKEERFKLPSAVHLQ